ncbi:helix-turn-helix domain-containing protein [Nocardia wallacei]|uniref:helix-turn-helix domain-containing protein n=1 Tax=Nocardia wallacei TaxID=480035 RepID=UPI0024573894|nr:helix-turn-helix transcriptional regulator [Nocardia wallacei]
MSGTGSTVPRRQLGRYLRELRSQTGMTIPEVARLAELSTSTIQRFEKGQFPAKIRTADIRELCAVLGADEPMTDALLGLAQQANNKSWYHDYGELIPKDFDVYIGLEAAAKTLTTYSPDAVIGLLQTADYARILIQGVYPGISPDELEQRVHLRMRRQALISRKRQPATLHAVLGEAALRRIVGTRRVMASQLKHLADMSTMPNISLHILPFDAGIPMGDPLGRFIVLDFPPGGKSVPAEPPVVYIENLTGDMYLEKPDDVRQYHEAYRAIQRSALDVEGSRALLRQLAREFAA